MNADEISAAIREAERGSARSLKLVKLDIETLPPEIGSLRQLESLTLKRNRLTTLPPELGNLVNLKLLSLGKNALSELPSCVFDLTNLEDLYISRNKLTTIPPEIRKLKKLKTLSLIRNRLRSLPPEIGELPDLRALLLRSNELTDLPPEIVKLTHLKTLEIRDNPLKPPLDEVAKDGVYAFMSYMLGLQFGEEMHDYVRQHLYVRDELKTALHQYLVYFSDYVKTAKDQDINFQVINIPGGLELRLRSSGPEQVERVAVYLHEYVSLIGQNLDNLVFRVEAELDETERRILFVEIRNQIRMLQSAVEIRNVKIDYLESEVQYLRSTLHGAVSRPAPILISATSASRAESESIAHASVNVALAELQQTFSTLTNEIKEIDPEAGPDLEALGTELDGVDEDVQTPDEIDKSLMIRVQRVLDDIQDPNSRIGRAVRGIRTGVRTAQKLGKAYNKIAQWMGLSQVPDPLLGA